MFKQRLQASNKTQPFMAFFFLKWLEQESLCPLSSFFPLSSSLLRSFIFMMVCFLSFSLYLCVFYASYPFLGFTFPFLNYGRSPLFGLKKIKEIIIVIIIIIHFDTKLKITHCQNVLVLRIDAIPIAWILTKQKNQ